MQWWIQFAWWIIFYFRHSSIKHETIAVNPPVQTYVNKIKNAIVFKIKAGYKLELLSPKATTLLGKKDVDQDKDGDDVSKLEFVEVVLVQCNLINSNYEQASKLFTFVPNRQFRQSINISPHSLTMLNITNTESKY